MGGENDFEKFIKDEAMTHAVCYECGEPKHGAFTACKRCGATPFYADEKIKSYLLSDHFFPVEKLNDMGANIRFGYAIEIEPASYEKHKENLLSQGIPLIEKSHGNRLINKIFGKKSPINSINEAQFYIIADQIYERDIYLVTKNERIPIPEAAFCQFLITSKQAGWSGGRRFFVHLNKSSKNIAYPRALEDGMGIYKQEALDFGSYLISNLKQQNLYSSDNQIVSKIDFFCKADGFTVRT